MPIRWTTVFLDLPRAGFDPAVSFWSEVTASSLSARRGLDEEFATLLPADGDACVRIQQVREGDGGRHLDLHVDRESLTREAQRMIGLGATQRNPGPPLSLAEGALPPWEPDDMILLASPGGFTFCLVGWAGETTVPGSVRLDAGGFSRLDQLCLDIPPHRFERECTFWTAATGWKLLRNKEKPEFAALEQPDAIPIRVLLQRLDETPAVDRVSAHVDIACTDRHALAARHVAAGARIVAEFPWWITLTDPVGQAYCLTRRSPKPIPSD